MLNEPISLAITPQASRVDDALQVCRTYARPADVIADSSLSVDERRAILSSWASDACAVESAPTLRRLPSSPVPVTFEEIRRALVQLDRMAARMRTAPARPRSARQPAFAAGEIPSW